MARRGSFYRNLDIKRALLMSSPFWLAAASQGLAAQSVSDEGSLRAAITAANGNTTPVTINLAAGTYAIPSGALENNNATGDYDIIRSGGNITLQGAGPGSTIIDGGNLDRIFQINTNGTFSVTIRDMTLRNGRATDNGNTNA